MKKLLLAFMILTFVIGCKSKEKEAVVEEETVTEKVKVTEVAASGATNNDDWIILFDGTNYNSWRGYNTDEMYSEWTIEDGTMAFTPGEEGGKNIITKEKFKNFVLSLEWKISPKGNSGIFWAVHEDEKFGEAYQTGPEIQVLDNAEHPDSFVAEGTHKAGSLYDIIKCPPELVNPAGEWNHVLLEINYDNNLGKLQMNGKEAFTFPLYGEGWDKMIENSKFKGWEGFGEYHEGHIGLQDHSDKVWYRNIKVRKI